MGPLSGGLVAGTIVLGVVGLALDFRRIVPPGWVIVLAALPGAWLLAADATGPRVGWVRVLVLVTSACGAVMVGSFCRRWSGAGVVPWMIAVTAAVRTNVAAAAAATGRVSNRIVKSSSPG